MLTLVPLHGQVPTLVLANIIRVVLSFVIVNLAIALAFNGRQHVCGIG